MRARWKIDGKGVSAMADSFTDFISLVSCSTNLWKNYSWKKIMFWKLFSYNNREHLRKFTFLLLFPLLKTQRFLYKMVIFIIFYCFTFLFPLQSLNQAISGGFSGNFIFSVKKIIEMRSWNRHLVYILCLCSSQHAVIPLIVHFFCSALFWVVKWTFLLYYRHKVMMRLVRQVCWF